MFFSMRHEDSAPANATRETAGSSQESRQQRDRKRQPRTLSQVKSRYAYPSVDANRITQFLVAVLAGLQVPFVCSETHELGEELVDLYLCQVHLYHWLSRTTAVVSCQTTT